MSRAGNRGSTPARDWAALLQAVRQAEADITPEAHALWIAGKWSDPRPSWGEDYVDAMQTALEGRQFGPLMKMLEAGIPVPDALVPTLAEIIRDARHGLSVGKPAALTEKAHETIRYAVDLYRGGLRMTAADAHEAVARSMGVSVDTVRRSLRRTSRKTPEA